MPKRFLDFGATGISLVLGFLGGGPFGTGGPFPLPLDDLGRAEASLASAAAPEGLGGAEAPLVSAAAPEAAATGPVPAMEVDLQGLGSEANLRRCSSHFDFSSALLASSCRASETGSEPFPADEVLAGCPFGSAGSA
mmetsp:Transcript_58942/g.127493  ORF Transcript_58942/g.127493 Transcript_58942/m.127493 type:complete len:137 (+) Transcript_58942:1577-1987(+)